LVTLQAPARAGTAPAGNGDVNGDGVIDISDALYLLRYLFQEGAGPVACADSPALVARVAALEEVIAELRSPCEERTDRFVDHGDGTVTDTCTGLMWMKKGEDLNGDGKFDNDVLSWDAANAYCASLSLAGYSGWRLPSLRELADLRVSTVGASPWSPPGPPFEVYPFQHWTSTRHPHPDFPDAAWVIEFQNNLHLLLPRQGACLVLAVRGPVAP
jgi:hypothetical protein